MLRLFVWLRSDREVEQGERAADPLSHTQELWALQINLLETVCVCVMVLRQAGAPATHQAVQAEHQKMATPFAAAAANALSSRTIPLPGAQLLRLDALPTNDDECTVAMVEAMASRITDHPANKGACREPQAGCSGDNATHRCDSARPGGKKDQGGGARRKFGDGPQAPGIRAQASPQGAEILQPLYATGLPATRDGECTTHFDVENTVKTMALQRCAVHARPRGYRAGVSIHI